MRCMAIQSRWMLVIYRDTLDTSVGESKTINLSMSTYDHNISSASYELYNDQYMKWLNLEVRILRMPMQWCRCRSFSK